MGGDVSAGAGEGVGGVVNGTGLTLCSIEMLGVHYRGGDSCRQ